MPLVLLVLFVLLFPPDSVLAAAAEGSASEGEGYVCPPCGCGEDGKVSHEPGSCTACRMKRIHTSELQRVAILLYDGVQIIDYTGPWEVFGQAGFEVFTVSADGKPVTTAMGMSVNPRYSFADSPAPTILLIPGGRGERQASANPATIPWVRKNAEAARHVLSVCNGALILARAGLLDGLKATTTYYLLEDLAELRPAVTVVRDQRWVDNGKIMTSAGLSSGIDAALHLVGKVRGLGFAQRTALQIEYSWTDDAGFVRAALADRHIPSLSGPDWERAELLSTSGDRQRWESRYKVESPLPAGALLARVKTVLENLRDWQAVGGAGPSDRAAGSWKFVDDDGHDWIGTARVEPLGGAAGTWSVVLSVKRSERPDAGAGS